MDYLHLHQIEHTHKYDSFISIKTHALFLGKIPLFSTSMPRFKDFCLGPSLILLPSYMEICSIIA